MKVSSLCFKCSEKSPSSIRIEGFQSLKEDNLYHFQCINGHDNLFEIQAFKFEILYESGLCAIKDKYFLESVLSLTAALERFYEFFIRIIMISNGISSENFEKVFKNISHQSERQYGAFLCIYADHFKKAPQELLKSRSTEFRNKVVHKGYLPNESEVLEYAEDIFYLIRCYYSSLRSKYQKTIDDYYFDIQKLSRLKYKELLEKLKIPIACFSPCLALSHSLNLDDFTKVNFRESYERVLRTPFYG